jgi:hypothetical protein
VCPKNKQPLFRKAAAGRGLTRPLFLFEANLTTLFLKQAAFHFSFPAVVK